MADVNDIVVQGFGAWSSVNSLPTLGFGSAAVAELPTLTLTLHAASAKNRELKAAHSQDELKAASAESKVLQ